MIGLYGKYVFKANTYKMVARFNIEFIGLWDGTHEEFISEYHKLYPNDQMHIFRHPKKSMSKSFRTSIEIYMENDPYFKRILRDERINDILSNF
jgi:hypothetical protein